jgi:hypothetical protein
MNINSASVPTIGCAADSREPDYSEAITRRRRFQEEFSGSAKPKRPLESEKKRIHPVFA